MNTMPTQTIPSQNGAALITGLIFLVVLTLISLSAIKSTSLEERMAGNARDQDVAFQAAEAGVRDALDYISSTGLLATSGFVAGCSAGLCLNDPAAPVWETITANNDWTSSKTKAYSGTALTFDGTTTLPVQPRYIIELLPATLPPAGFSMASGKGANPGGQVTPFRVTARGWGITGQTQVTVQAAINY
jgi:type IV pilus assembly protein PilX